MIQQHRSSVIPGAAIPRRGNDIRHYRWRCRRWRRRLGVEQADPALGGHWQALVAARLR